MFKQPLLRKKNSDFFTIRQLLDLGLHIGHKSRLRYRNHFLFHYMHYTFGTYYVYSIMCTVSFFRRALLFIEMCIQKKQKLLYLLISPSKVLQKFVFLLAERLFMFVGIIALKNL